VIVVMEHTAQNGDAKLRRECTLPLTGTRVVQRVITDLCVLDITQSGFEVVELAHGVTREQAERTADAPLRFSSALMPLH